jgi:CBS domain-containing protein
MKATDIMSREVVTVSPDDTVLHAARLMLQKRFSGLPVVDAAGALVGMVTEGDLLRRAEIGTVRRRPRWLEFLISPGRLAEEYSRTAGRFVKEIMARDVLAVTEDTELDEIVGLMERNKVKRIPVTHGNRLVGIVTRQNIVRAFASQVPAKSRAPDDDDAIRERILAEMSKHTWVPALNVIVTNGTAKLVGTIFDERQRGALHVLAENVPGVKGIDDEIALIEPMSGTVIPPAAA